MHYYVKINMKILKQAYADCVSHGCWAKNESGPCILDSSLALIWCIRARATSDKRESVRAVECEAAIDSEYGINLRSSRADASERGPRE